MFGAPKPAFGQTTSTFGGFGSTGTTSASPFTTTFGKPAGTGAFGAAPAFGSTATGSTPGLFGASSTPGSGLFGSSNTSGGSAPTFGTTTGQQGFSFGQSNTGTLFGGNTQTGSTLFGQPSTSSQNAFGAKPGGFGFGGTSTANTGTGLFGATPQPSTGLFGQQSTTPQTTGIFGSSGGFGGQQPTGTVVKYAPLGGTDVMVKGGQSQPINISYNCITFMKEYENKSLEELRMEDYAANRKGPQAGATPGLFGTSGGTPAFGAPATGAFGQAKTGGMFGQSTGFGQPATTSSTSIFGTNTGFGSTQSTGIFGSTTTQPTPAFGAMSSGTNTFGFGNTATQAPGTGLFGAKPATSGFGLPQTTSSGSAFGAFGSNTTPVQPSTGFFGAKLGTTSATPAFGTTTPAFGTGTGAFNTSVSSSSNLFGGNTFGAKSATATPSFGFGNTQPQTGGLGTNLSLGNSLFGGKSTNTGGSLFPSFTGQLNTEPSVGFNAGNTLNTGLTGGLGSFGNTLGSRLGTNTGTGIGGTLGTGLGFNNTGLANMGGLGSNTNSGMSVHEQILTLAAKPFGDSPLFKDLVPTSGSLDVQLKPTNPAAQRAVTEGDAYRVSPPAVTDRLRVRPLLAAPLRDKKSLFDGLEESDASLEEKLSLRPNAKRLVLRPKAAQSPRAASGPDSTASPAVGEENRSGQEKEGGVSLDTSSSSAPKPDSTSNAPATRNSSSFGNDASPVIRGLNTDLNVESERRASWLTTKPSYKPVSHGAVDREQQDTTVSVFGGRSGTLSPSLYPSLASLSGNGGGLLDREDKENIESPVAEERNPLPDVVTEPHPTRIKLTRPGYYTIPSLDDLIGYIREDGSCVVPHFTIGRRGYGNVHYDCEMDVAGLDLDDIVHFLNKEVIVYPEEVNKPPVGEGLNRKALVTLDRIWPRDKTAKQSITDPERLAAMDYEGKLRRVCDKHDTKFIEYRPQTGSWVFKVAHFSKYGLSDSDEEEDDIAAGTAAAAAAKPGAAGAAALKPGEVKPGEAVARKGLGGPMAVSGVFPMLEDKGDALIVPSAQEKYQAHASQLTMDTGDENSNESATLYSDSRVFGRSGMFQHKGGLKSPTSELAQLDSHSSHSVQLMKACLYSEMEFEDMADDASHSTADQLVPDPHAAHSSSLWRQQIGVTPRATSALVPPSVAESMVVGSIDKEAAASSLGEEICIRAPVARPKTMAVRAHGRRVPLSRSIAGRLGAACLADRACSHARTFRVGWGARDRLLTLATSDRATALASASELPELWSYLEGRTEQDSSPTLLMRLSIGGGDASNSEDFAGTIAGHLQAVLQHSELVEAGEGHCPKLAVRLKAGADLLHALAHEARRLADRARTESKAQFGVSAEYCSQVWDLCSALWGADINNDGVPPRDDLSVLNRHRALSAWLSRAVSDAVDRELEKPIPPEEIDANDSHSAAILTLLSGGRVLEACQLARKCGDYNMALILSQIGGDTKVRALVALQVAAWRDCGALQLVAAPRLAALLLAAGRTRDEPGEEHMHVCDGIDWLRAFAMHFWYICEPVSTVEEAVAAFEKSLMRPRHFVGTDDDENMLEETQAVRRIEDLDAAVREGGVAFPAPPYSDEFDVEIDTVEPLGSSRRSRVVDLRYRLLRARALNERPAVEPASHTPDPLDYRLSWLLETWLCSVGVCAGSGARPAYCAGLAAQLEAAGLWHYAVMVLMFLPDDRARSGAVREAVLRHAPATARDAAARNALSFLHELHVPPHWLHEAQAIRAKYEHLPSLEAEHLASAKQWNSAHTVLLEHLLPNAVLADNLESLKPLLERLSEAAGRQEISGWEHGGQALYEYLHVCSEIRAMVERGELEGGTGSRRAVTRRLEALRPRVALACGALVSLRVDGCLRRTVAKCEMGARLVQLAGGALAAGSGALSPAAASHLAALLSRLQLPSDYVQNVLRKIMESIAEDTSDDTPDSASSSPHSFTAGIKEITTAADN